MAGGARAQDTGSPFRADIAGNLPLSRDALHTKQIHRWPSALKRLLLKFSSAMQYPRPSSKCRAWTETARTTSQSKKVWEQERHGKTSP